MSRHRFFFGGGLASVLCRRHGPSPQRRRPPARTGSRLRRTDGASLRKVSHQHQRRTYPHSRAKAPPAHGMGQAGSTRPRVRPPAPAGRYRRPRPSPRHSHHRRRRGPRRPHLVDPAHMRTVHRRSAVRDFGRVSAAGWPRTPRSARSRPAAPAGTPDTSAAPRPATMRPPPTPGVPPCSSPQIPRSPRAVRPDGSSLAHADRHRGPSSRDRVQAKTPHLIGSSRESPDVVLVVHGIRENSRDTRALMIHKRSRTDSVWSP